MANLYLRSTDGSDSDNGTTWALAKATLAGIDAIDAAGDNIYISSVHSESTAANITIALAGTAASPQYLLSVNDAAEPPTALATGATITCNTTNGVMTITDAAYVYGITFVVNGGGTTPTINMQPNTAHKMVVKNCTFYLQSTGASGRIRTGSSSNSGHALWQDCQVRFGASGQAISVIGGLFEWRGGGIHPSSTNIGVAIVTPNGTPCEIRCDGVDFSTVNIVNGIVNTSNHHAGYPITFRNCKFPASTNLIQAALTKPGARVAAYNCDSGDTNYKIWIEDFAGVQRDETTLVRSSGASDGTTPLAWKMTTNANANPVCPLISTEIIARNTVLGTSRTATVEILHDSVTALTDGEIWLELEFQGTSGYPLATFADDARATVLTTPANQSTSSVTWTTTGLTNPNKQKLEVTFTAQEEGWVIARVIHGKTSKVVYVDPVLTIT